MKRLAIYYRVSTDRQDFESQQAEVERWIANLPRPPQEVFVYTDKVSGKAHDNRPGLTSMLEAALKGEVDTIVCYRLDRLSRNRRKAMRMWLDLMDAGVDLFAVDEAQKFLSDPNLPFRQSLLSLFMEMADMEREAIVGRVREGLAAAKARGVRLGAPPKLTPADAATARDLAMKGYSMRAIAKKLGCGVASVHRLIHRGAVDESVHV